MPDSRVTQWWRIPVLLTLMLLGACGGDDAPPPTTPPTDHVIRLYPTAGVTIGVAQSQFTYVELDTVPASSRPLRLGGNELVWSSSRPEVASVDAAGLITGHMAGETRVTARRGTLEQTITVRVTGSLTRHNVSIAGQGTRPYALWMPEPAAGSAARPLLLSLHGAGGSASIQASMTLLTALAAREGLVLASLEGSGFVPTFNAGGCCGYAQSMGIDDVAYARAVIDDVIARTAIDPARIYVTGFSNGAMMSHRLACALSDRIAGIAAVSGSPVHSSCVPARPIPILHVHATNDRIVPFEGGFSGELPGPAFLPVRTAIAEIVARNNVAAQPVATSVTPTTTCYRYAVPADPARPSAPVELCEVNPVDNYDPVSTVVYGGGHSWPGGLPSPASGSDIPLHDFVVNERIWGFFNP